MGSRQQPPAQAAWWGHKRWTGGGLGSQGTEPPSPTSGSAPRGGGRSGRTTLSCPLPTPGFFGELSGQPGRRQQAALTEHLLRMETRPVLTELPPEAGCVTPEPGDQPRLASSPQASPPGTKPRAPAPRGQKSSALAGKGPQAASATATAPRTSVARAPGTTKTSTKTAKQ